jgi:hypothetical protein
MDGVRKADAPPKREPSELRDASSRFLQTRPNANARTSPSPFATDLVIDDGDYDDDDEEDNDDDDDDDDDGESAASVYAKSTYPRIDPAHKVEHPYDPANGPGSHDDGTM